jgi:transposase-like protein
MVQSSSLMLKSQSVGTVGILGIEEIKRLNMVEFLSRHYGLDFSKGGVSAPPVGAVGGQYRCLSPFNDEHNPSFFVREVNGHWLFKDFSSGHGGSLIDYVQHKEGFDKVSEALSYIEHLLGVEAGGCSECSEGASSRLPSSTVSTPPSTSSISSIRKPSDVYNVEEIYNKLLRNDVMHSREYLLERSINPEVVDHLCRGKLLVHNEYKGHSYCCFAVFNAKGELCCLDNHQIGGDGKFVLGHKQPFSLDWSQLPLSERVFVTESIIDYLSIKTLEGFDFRGVALLGNVLNFSSELFGSAREVVSALDGDRGGFRAFLDLEEKYSDRDRVIGVYDFGDSKDANEYLQKRKERQRGKRLSAEDKLSLYRDFQRSENKLEVASRWGINRSYMYEIVKECEEFIVLGFSGRRVGRKPEGEPETLQEARERLKELEGENRRIDEERERYWVRSEFLKVRLKWAEQETGEPGGKHGEEESDAGNPSSVDVESKNRKKHLKKKRRKKS